MTEKHMYRNNIYGNNIYRNPLYQQYVYKDYQALKLKLGLSLINYSYIIIDKRSGEAAIVDPAWDPGKITAVLNEFGVRLTKILLTHSHVDHVNLVPALVRLYNPAVFMSGVEIDYYGFCGKNLNPASHLERIELGQTQIDCLLTPGHTAGGMCFMLPHIIFTGDTVFTEGCGICSLPGGSPDDMFDSIQMIKQKVHPDTLVFPAHSYGREPGYPLSFLLEENIYFVMENRDMFVRFRMRKNQKFTMVNSGADRL